MKLHQTIPGAKGFTPTVMPAGHLDAANFNTLPLPPRIKEAPGFWQTDEGRQQLADAFVAFLGFERGMGWLGHNRLFERVMEHTHCIDPLTFNAALEQMRQSLIQFLGGLPYSFVCLAEGRSESFVMDSLLRRGLPRKPNKRYKSGRIRLRRGMKYVVVDDATYSGNYLLKVLRDLHNAHVPRESIFLGVIGMTHFLRPFERHAGYVYAGLRMSTITHLVPPMTSWEVEMLSDGDKQQSALSFPWYKIPDRLFPMLWRTLAVREGHEYPGNPSRAPDYAALLEMMTPKS